MTLKIKNGYHGNPVLTLSMVTGPNIGKYEPPRCFVEGVAGSIPERCEFEDFRHGCPFETISVVLDFRGDGS